MANIFFILILFFTTSCVSLNLTMNMVHTEGSASDVVDDTDSLTSTPKVDATANVSVPVSPL